MAFRLKHWLGTGGLGLALIMVWRLPLDFVGQWTPPARPDAVERYAELAGELRRAQVALDQNRRASRLTASVVPSAEHGVSVFFPEEGSVTPDERATLRSRLLGELATLGANEPGVVVGYGYDVEGGVAVSRPRRLETYLGESDGTPYCVQVAVTRRESGETALDEDLAGEGWSRRTGSLLGPCAFFAAYGPAGPHIQEWLERGGIAFAWVWSGDRTRLEGTRRRTVLGVTTIGLSTDVERCLTGVATLCEEVFLDPRPGNRRGTGGRSVAVTSAASFSQGVGNGPFPAQNPYLLSDLEREFGRDAFGRFWTSELDVSAAFEAAFGVDLGEWLVGWLDEGPGIEPATPAPTLSATLGSLLLISLMTGLATFRQRRRRAG